MGEERKTMVVVCETGGQGLMVLKSKESMPDESNNDMKHEDDSVLTKFTAITSVLVIGGIIVAGLFVIWEVLKFFFLFD